jgi:hypothetical protein
MLTLLAINIHYKGCPFIRMERKLLGIPSWIGIHEYLRAFTPNPHKKLINAMTLATALLLMLAFWIAY